MSTKPKNPPMPAAGGRYVRQRDGKLVQRPIGETPRPPREPEAPAETDAEQPAPDAAAKKGK